MKSLLPSIYFTANFVQANIYNIQTFYRSTPNSNIEKIEDYGCWCVFTDMTSGHGRAQDGIDTACKHLHDNYRCIVKEFQNEVENSDDSESDSSSSSALNLSSSCDPSTVEYIFEIDTVKSLAEISSRARNIGAASPISSDHVARDNLLKYCENNNNSACAEAACKADLNFLFESFSLMFNAEKANELLDRKNFDYQNECGANNKGNNEKVECCGQVPDQIVYSPKKSGMECCVAAKAIYNPVTEICEGEYVVSLTSELDPAALIVDMTADFDFGR